MTVVTRGAALPTSSNLALDGAEAATLDQLVDRVASKASEWAATTPAVRVALLDRIIADTMAASEAWLADACRAKGLSPNSPEAGEELFAGIGTFVRVVRLLRDSVRQIEKTGRPQFPGPVRKAADGRLRVGVFPISPLDRLLFAQTTAEVWMQPGVTEAELEADQAWAYKDPQGHQGLDVVLAAGNVASLGPRDVLYKLFVEGRVVIMKGNPVNEYLLPHWERAFACLIERGFLAIVEGGAAVGAHLNAHPKVTSVHVTGSDKTYDAIVFGVGEEGARRKAANEPLLDKPVTAELGNVSPVIIVPGNWSPAEIAYQAEHVATMLVNNAGFNCLALRVIVTHAGWPQREAFMRALTEVLRRIPLRRAYYPGAGDRFDTFLAAHPGATEVGARQGDVLPWTIVQDVDPTKVDDISFNVESFCGLTSETALAASSAAEFLDAAVAFCNDVVWGTLSASVIVDPRTARDPAVAAAVERAVADLRYGGIGLNTFHGLVFALGQTTWGAYPGHPMTDIQSGTGVVGNAFMLARTQKSVVKGPFRTRPKPPYFATNRNALPVMRKLLAFEADPSPLRLPGLFAAALRP